MQVSRITLNLYMPTIILVFKFLLTFVCLTVAAMNN